MTGKSTDWSRTRGNTGAGDERDIGPFHMHRGHAFGGFRIEEQHERLVVIADCACGDVLAVADAVLAPCPACASDGAACSRCGASGRVVDHAALRWRLPPSREAR